MVETRHCLSFPTPEQRKANAAGALYQRADSGALKLLQRETCFGASRSVWPGASGCRPVKHMQERRERKKAFEDFSPCSDFRMGREGEGAGLQRWESRVTVPFVLPHCSVPRMEQAGTGKRLQRPRLAAAALARLSLHTTRPTRETPLRSRRPPPSRELRHSERPGSLLNISSCWCSSLFLSTGMEK